MTYLKKLSRTYIQSVTKINKVNHFVFYGKTNRLFSVLPRPPEFSSVRNLILPQELTTILSCDNH